VTELLRHERGLQDDVAQIASTVRPHLFAVLTVPDQERARLSARLSGNGLLWIGA
jgi:hypothetical protein